MPLEGRQPKVNIILATYNGAQGIIRQLDSLWAQTYSNIDIYIRDDGSKDNTVELIEDYIQKHPGGPRVIFLENHGVNLNCPGSFYEILKRCEPAEYYSLCDQDDEWYSDKVARAVARLEQEDDRQVLVYYSACDYKTTEGEFIRKSPQQKEHLQLHDVLYYTPGSGFTVVINEVARQKLLFDHTPGKELHDRWLIRGGVCLGKVIYDSESTAAHLRHKEAYTAGDADNKSLIYNFIHQELLGDDALNDKKNIAYFYGQFEHEIPREEKKDIQLFASEKKSPIIWLRKVFYPRRLRRRWPGEVALRMLFFVGKV